jgi:hypothetical protein
MSSTWDLEKVDSNQFVETRMRNEADYYLRKTRELAQDLDRLRDAPLLTRAIVASIDWYLERYTRVNQGITISVGWEAQLRYMSGCVVGDQLLLRAGIEVLPLVDQVRFDPVKPNDPLAPKYFEYVAQARVKWDDWLSRKDSDVVTDEMAVATPIQEGHTQ